MYTDDPRNSASLLETLQQKSDGAENREQEQREKEIRLHRTDYAENRWLHGDTALPTQRLQKYADTDRCNNEYVYVCNKYEQITKQGYAKRGHK